jgi:ribonuclease P protein component
MQQTGRLRSKRDFAAVYKAGKVHGNHLLVLRVAENQAGVSRFGFVAGKTVGNAVTRNRVKRRLREIVRMFCTRPGVDVVVGARKAAAEATFDALRRSYEKLATKSGAITGEAPARTSGARL